MINRPGINVDITKIQMGVTFMKQKIQMELDFLKKSRQDLVYVHSFQPCDQVDGDKLPPKPKKLETTSNKHQTKNVVTSSQCAMEPRCRLLLLTCGQISKKCDTSRNTLQDYCQSSVHRRPLSDGCFFDVIFVSIGFEMNLIPRCNITLIGHYNYIVSRAIALNYMHGYLKYKEIIKRKKTQQISFVLRLFVATKVNTQQYTFTLFMLYCNCISLEMHTH